MKKLFEEITLGKIPVRNRLVRSATHEYGGTEDGLYTPHIFHLYQGLAKGGVGLIISGMVGIDANARLVPTMIKAYDDSFVPGLKELADAVHTHGCKLVMQISHCGAKVKQTDSGEDPVGMSSLPDRPEKTIRELTTGQLAQVVASFAATAARCKSAGADGVQIHGAHGYLISQSLSPIFNRRTDAYGGPIENRARLLFEVYRAIRAAVGEDYPVWIKINSSDVSEGGLTFDECAWVCSQLDDMGINAIELSGGIGISRESAAARLVKEEKDEGYFFDEALELAGKIKADVISVGGYRTPALLEQRLNAGNIKALSLGRPLIAEPGLPNRWREGDTRKAICISCNKCYAPEPLSCKVFPA